MSERNIEIEHLDDEKIKTFDTCENYHLTIIDTCDYVINYMALKAN